MDKGRMPNLRQVLAGFLCRAMAVGVFAAVSSLLLAQERDLSSLDLEQLANVKVTSVAKREQSLLEAPAAVYVITQDEIRRSGATCLADLLRGVPGMDVAQADGSRWAISARGYNGQWANKLLVLIDGRSVYTPLYSGVYWDAQDLLLADVERIEVIRGPGATMWGANAVNGVINVITKNARDTQGGWFSLGASTTERRFGEVRYGGRFPHNGHFRAFTKYFKRDGLLYPNGQRSTDMLDSWRGGFRSDLALSGRDELSWQAAAYAGNFGQRADRYGVDPLLESENEIASMSGGHILARWHRTSSSWSDFSLQAYFDTTRRNELVLGQRINIFDLEFQQRRRSGRHEFVWGLGYRRAEDRLRDSPSADWRRLEESTNLFSGFAQDEVSFFDRRLRLTFGSKFEHNDYTGPEIQPNARLWLAVAPRHDLWAAVSRAVRIPSRAERDIALSLYSRQLPDGTIAVVRAIGNPQLGSEKLLAYEAGYRWQAASRASLDIATYFNTYEGGVGLSMGAPVPESTPPPVHILVPIWFNNNVHSDAYGMELAGKLQVTHFWRVSAAETWARMVLHAHSPQMPQGFMQILSGESPLEQLSIQSTFLLPRNLELNAASGYVSRLANQQVPPYTRLDFRLAWQPAERLQFSIGGQNLLAARHAEYRSLILAWPTEVRRSVYTRLEWTF